MKMEMMPNPSFVKDFQRKTILEESRPFIKKVLDSEIFERFINNLLDLIEVRWQFLSIPA